MRGALLCAEVTASAASMKMVSFPSSGSESWTGAGGRSVGRRGKKGDADVGWEKKKDSRWGPPVSIGFFFVKREKAEDNGGRSRHEMSDSGVKRKKRRRKRDSRMYFYILYRRAARQARPENKKKKKGTNPTENSKARKVFGSDGRALEHQCGKGGHDGPITARSPVLALNRNWRETDVIGHSRVSDANS